MTSTTKTQAPALDTVAAEAAPLGVLLWPVRDEKYAPNFTLDRVETIRTVNGTRVRWVYQSGAERFFDLGEHVVVTPSAVAR